MGILRQLTVRSLPGCTITSEWKRLRQSRAVEYLFAIYDQLHCRNKPGLVSVWRVGRTFVVQEKLRRNAGGNLELRWCQTEVVKGSQICFRPLISKS